MIKLKHLKYFLGALIIILVILISSIACLIYSNQTDYVQLLISSVIVTGSFTVALFIYYLDQRNKRKYLLKSLIIFLEHLNETFNDDKSSLKFIIDSERVSLRLFSRNTISHIINSGYLLDINRDLLLFQSDFDFYYMVLDAHSENVTDNKEANDFIVQHNQILTYKIVRLISMVKLIDK